MAAYHVSATVQRDGSVQMLPLRRLDTALLTHRIIKPLNASLNIVVWWPTGFDPAFEEAETQRYVDELTRSSGSYSA